MQVTPDVYAWMRHLVMIIQPAYFTEASPLYIVPGATPSSAFIAG